MEYEILYEEIFILAMVAKPIAKVHSKPQNKTKQNRLTSLAGWKWFSEISKNIKPTYD